LIDIGSMMYYIPVQNQAASSKRHAHTLNMSTKTKEVVLSIKNP